MERDQLCVTSANSTIIRPPTLAVLTLEQVKALRRVDGRARYAGVYFLWQGDRLVYIGQSRDIYKRICKHRQSRKAVFDYATSVMVDYPWHLALERLYIDAFLQQHGQEASSVCLISF